MDEDSLREFLAESAENLDLLDRELVALEAEPTNAKRLASIFRAVHTIKGTAGFFSFSKLEAVTHVGENLLSRLRDGVVVLENVRTTALLAMVDAVRELLKTIEANGAEGDGHYGALIEALAYACEDIGLADADEILRELSPASASRPALSVPAPKAELSPEPSSEPEMVETAAAEPRHEAEPASERAAHAPVAESKAHDERVTSDARIRVDVRLLDKLMNLVGELVLTRNQLLQHAGGSSEPAVVGSCQRLNLITTELQEGVMKTRMQPIDNVWSRFPRVVRDLAHACGKQVRLEMEGKNTELDKTIIEAIGDPLTHLVRNAIDHGIERPERRAAAGKLATGTLKLRAFHEGGRVNIEIADDGGGIDPERVRAKAVAKGLLTSERARMLNMQEVFALLFAPGFSTAEAITNISGRGVGLDVVKNNIERLGGTVDVESRLGHGTAFRIRIPLTLAIIPALLVGSGGERFAVPQVNLVELVRLEADQAARDIERLHGVPLYRRRGSLLALIELSDLLGLPPRDASRDVVVVVVQADDRKFGLLVDAIYDTEEIVVKPLGRELKGLGEYAGATIMGDGSVALILDVAGLAELAGVAAAERTRTSSNDGRDEQSQGARSAGEPILLLRAGLRSRFALPLDMVARLEEFSSDRVEHMGGADVIQYRGDILPLVYLADVFGEPRAERETLPVVVHSTGKTTIGVVVDAIEDVTSEEPTCVREGGRFGVARSAVIQGRVTEMLDVSVLFSQMGAA